MKPSIAIWILTLVVTVAAAGCGKQDEDSKDALSKDPERLRTVLRDCRDPSRINDARCRAASDAVRERFLRHDETVVPANTGPAPSINDPVPSPAKP